MRKLSPSSSCTSLHFGHHLSTLYVLVSNECSVLFMTLAGLNINYIVLVKNLSSLLKYTYLSTANINL